MLGRRISGSTDFDGHLARDNAHRLVQWQVATELSSDPDFGSGDVRFDVEPGEMGLHRRQAFLEMRALAGNPGVARVAQRLDEPALRVDPVPERLVRERDLSDGARRDP